MARLGELLAIPIGLFVVKQITDRIDKEPVEPIKPVIPTTGPAGPDIRDFNLLPKIKITQEQLSTFDPSRPAEIRPYKPGLVAQPISQGKVIPLGFRQGETGDDLVRRLFNR